MAIEDYKFLNTNSLLTQQGSTIRLGQVDKTYFIDDSENTSKKYPEYDVILFDDTGGQTVLRNVRSLQLLGSANDSSELIYEDSQFAFEKALDEENAPQNKNGSLVLVIFLDNSMYKPYILGTINHPKIESGATREKGPHSYTEFRGLRQEINKDGELEITFNGPKMPNGKPEVADQKPITIKIGKGGEITSQGGHQMIFTSNEEGDRFQIITAGSQLIQVEDTEGEEAISIVHKKGAMLNIDKAGTAQVIASDGGYLLLNAEANEVSLVQKAGNMFSITPNEITLAHKDGSDIVSMTKDKIQVTSGGSVSFQPAAFGVSAGTIDLKDQLLAGLKVENGLVALGGPTAELLDLFDQLLDQLTTLLTSMSTETHVGNLGYPTAPPTNAPAYLAVQAQIMIIKAFLLTIKGTL